MNLVDELEHRSVAISRETYFRMPSPAMPSVFDRLTPLASGRPAYAVDWSFVIGP